MVCSKNKIVFQADFRIRIIKVIYLLTAGLFGRGYGLVMRNIPQALMDKMTTVKLTKDSKFTFNLNDFYWNRIVVNSYHYEPELEYIFNVVKNMDFVLLDCGANIGYWSVLVSSQNFGKKRAVAIEATPKTFGHLQINQKINNDRFAVLNNAIFNKDGCQLTMSDAIHHAANQIERINVSGKQTVQSITIDSIVKTQNIGKDSRIVVKLDVEGQEINALKGARNALQHDTLLIYEDHGKETRHDVTRFVMEELEFNVFYVDVDCSIIKILDVDDLDSIKTSKGIGYNFFACKISSDFYPVLNDLVG